MTLALTGYRLGYGARGLRLLIQNAIGDAILRLLLAGPTVTVGVADGKDSLAVSVSTVPYRSGDIVVLKSAQRLPKIHR